MSKYFSCNNFFEKEFSTDAGMVTFSNDGSMLSIFANIDLQKNDIAPEDVKLIKNVISELNSVLMEIEDAPK